MFKNIEIHNGKQLDLKTVSLTLAEFGYRRVDAVTEQAEYARRGGVLDVYPPDFECPLRVELDDDSVSSLRSFNPVSGDVLEEHRAALLLPVKGLKPKQFSIEGYNDAEETPLDTFVDLEIGDYVVHVKHGIGRYSGIEQVDRDGLAGDHFVIEYAESDRLFVPCDQLHLLQKYVSFEGRKPKLYKLGSKMWERIKKKTAQGVWRFAYDLLDLEANRVITGGVAFPEDTDWQRDFEALFPFEETPGQRQALDEVRRDMESAKPMDRLLMGDVGYGKTEVAMRAAFKAVMGNKQVAILVPTTILAEQHYANFRARTASFPVRVEMLSRFRTSREQKIVLKDTADGKVDILIGTHRLLSKDVAFSDLGLVIIDEEQRFGVKHKETLKKMRYSVDVLTLTATPIPRTLYMALTGARDMSSINTPPQNRFPVRTYVGDFNESIVQSAIMKEVTRKGQVFFVHNRVMSIDKLYHRLKKIIPDVRMAVAHGQMSSRQLERVILSFIAGEIDVLLSTTIIESGMDIPNANTLIVYPADAFGLADLYQLRGRVGRFTRKAYAYFLLPKGHVATTDARRRLYAIEHHTELGSGFKIAMEDLQIRGAGNLLGTQQHGYVSAVGFDLYCRLLKGAVNQLKKNKAHMLQLQAHTYD